MGDEKPLRYSYDFVEINYAKLINVVEGGVKNNVGIQPPNCRCHDRNSDIAPLLYAGIGGQEHDKARGTRMRKAGSPNISAIAWEASIATWTVDTLLAEVRSR